MKDQQENKIALVIGAGGGIGGTVACALLGHGWQVRGMVRNPDKAKGGSTDTIDWIKGDAMVLDDVVRAAQGASVIVHAVHPAGYRNWDSLVMSMLHNTIAAAKAVGADRIVLPGTIYNFDPVSNRVVNETTAQNATSRKGKIRIDMEQALREASTDVPVLIVRAGDFFGPGAGASWFSEAMVAKGSRLKRIVNPAAGGGHSWAYLPDLGEVFAQLLDREDDLKPFEEVHFEGTVDESGHLFTDAIMKAVGRKLPVWRMPWWIFRLLSPFGGFPREVVEIIPHWKSPMRLDNRRLLALLGSEPRTKVDEAIKATLADLQCT